MTSKHRMPPDFVVGQLIAMVPPGKEVLDIAKDLNLLADSGEKISKLVRNFYEKYSIRIDKSFRVSKYNQLELEDDGGSSNTAASPQCYYANPLSGEVILVDYRGASLGTVKVDKVNELFDLASGNEFLSSIKTLLSKSSPDDRELFSSVYETDQPNACIFVTGLTEQMEVNFWSIHCCCVWTVSRDPESNSLGLSGEVNVTVHYYEAGANFQIRVDNLKIKKQTGIESLEKVFAKIKLKILKIKTRIHDKFFLPTESSVLAEDIPGKQAPLPQVRSTPPSAQATAAFAPIPVTILKKLRRQLPIQKTKFDWNLHKALLIQNLS